MNFTAKQVAEFLNGEVVGNEDVTVSNISKIEEGKPGTLSFLGNPKYEKFIYSTNASIVLVNKDFSPSNTISATLIKVDNAYEAFASLLGLYDQAIKNKEGISSNVSIGNGTDIGNLSYLGDFSVIGDNVTIGKGTKIYPQVYIGDNVTIGENVVLYPGVKVYHSCVVGNNCILHSGCVIGADGFGFAPQSDNNYKKVPQVGIVVLEDNVEIGANTTIDRATLGSTVIKKGVKIDNLVQIAHNVEVNENTVIAAQSGVSGSTKIGKNVMIAGQVGFAGHLTIGDGAKFAAQSGIANNIKANTVNQGAPAYNYRDYQKSYIYFKKLPETNDRITKLEQEIKELKELLSKK